MKSGISLPPFCYPPSSFPTERYCLNEGLQLFHSRMSWRLLALTPQTTLLLHMYSLDYTLERKALSIHLVNPVTAYQRQWKRTDVGADKKQQQQKQKKEGTLKPCAAPQLCAFVCVCVVIALKLLWPHVNSIFIRHLPLCGHILVCCVIPRSIKHILCGQTCTEVPSNAVTMAKNRELHKPKVGEGEKKYIYPPTLCEKKKSSGCLLCAAGCVHLY